MLKVLGSVGMLVLLLWVMADAAGLGVFIDIYSLVIVFVGAALFWLAAGGVEWDPVVAEGLEASAAALLCPNGTLASEAESGARGDPG